MKKFDKGWKFTNCQLFKMKNNFKNDENPRDT